MHPRVKELVTKCAEVNPKVWNQCYPKSFINIGDYYSPVLVSIGMFGALAMVVDIRKRDDRLRTDTSFAMLAAKSFEYGFPQLFASKEFVEACMNTELPNDLKWTDVNLPFEA